MVAAPRVARPTRVLWCGAVDESDTDAQALLGWFYNRLGRRDDAVRIFDSVVQREPVSDKTWCWLGHACCALGDWPKAFQAYCRAAKLGSAVALANLAALYTDAHQLFDALQCLATARASAGDADATLKAAYDALSRLASDAVKECVAPCRLRARRRP